MRPIGKPCDHLDQPIAERQPRCGIRLLPQRLLDHNGNERRIPPRLLLVVNLS
jgi:hypothetical protein